MTDENSFLLDVLKRNDSFDVGVGSFKPDAIQKLADRKKKRESFREKKCLDWIGIDFIRYFDWMLKSFGVIRVANYASDCNRIYRLYDLLAERLGSLMTNDVLKDYLSWWASIWASKYSGKDIHLNLLMQDWLVDRFSSRYSPHSESIKEHIPETNEFSDAEIYDFGGLEILLIKRGIVVSYRFLKSKSAIDAYGKIRDALSHLSKDVFVCVVETTIKHAPYESKDYIDFIEISKSFILGYGLKDFQSLIARDFFRKE